MEKNFYTDNFEQLLKESTENFRMYPSKRVWHSIYNDLHPSRKWPSLAIWVLLISSVVYISLSNKSQVLNTAANTKIAGLNTGNVVLNATADINPIKAQSFDISILNNSNNLTSNTSTDNKNSDIANNNRPTQQSSNSIVRNNLKSENLKNKINIHVELPNNEIANDLHTNAIASIASLEKSNTNLINETENDLTSTADVSKPIDNKTELGSDINLTNKKPEAKKDDTEKKVSAISNKNLEKEWIEDYAFHNKPFGSKWKSHLTYELYFTPSVGYRILSKNSTFNPVSSSLISTTGSTPLDYKEALRQIAEVNMEIGGAALYNISKRLNLKAGVQLNYTNYGINAYELKHPTLTTIILKDLNTGLPVLEPRSTTLANASGISSKRLNNNTYQVSLPLGINLKLAGNDNLKWYVGATIQPTYIIAGNSYLISTDLKNYIADKSLMQKWNLNTGVETFISYKTKSGIVINAGPQFRYQLFSTYTKQYTYDEKLYNVGLKIGIITRF